MDAYTRRARLAPGVLAALPALLLLIAAALAPTAESSQVAVIGSALALLLCAVIRDRGRRIEPALWAGWGGAPTSAALRWRTSVDPAQTALLHAHVARATALALPGAQAERDSPADAERAYRQAVLVLRERTRDAAAFPLVFAENTDYGFRRNLLGLRPIALAIAIAVLLAALVLALAGHRLFLLPAAAALLCAVCWWRLITPDWVHLAAERYAERLLAAAVTLPDPALP